jgi:hypothetical protein
MCSISVCCKQRNIVELNYNFCVFMLSTAVDEESLGVNVGGGHGPSALPTARHCIGGEPGPQST